MPGERVYQSSGSASGENMTIDLNDQSSTQNSVSAFFDMVQLFSSTFSLCLMYIPSFPLSFHFTALLFSPPPVPSVRSPPPEFSPPQKLNSPPVPSVCSHPPEFSPSQELNSPPVLSGRSHPPEFSPPQELNSPPVSSVRSPQPVASLAQDITCWHNDQSFRSASWEGDYDTYLSLIRAASEDEEEDEDLCCAIMASIEDQT